MTFRIPTRITVQYREVPYLPPQVRITRHYGRGIPREYHCILARPHGVDGEWWAWLVASRIDAADMGPAAVILRPEVTI